MTITIHHNSDKSITIHYDSDKSVTVLYNEGVGIAQWLEHWIRESRVQIPAGAAGELSSPGLTFCADSYFGIHSTPVLLQ